MADLNLKMPTSGTKPTSVIEWLALITNTIGDLKGVDWFSQNALTLKQLCDAINNDSQFATTITNAINSKLNSSQYTAADILSKLKTVDGSGSGLDADTVRGYDPVNKAGDTLTGFLTLHADPSNAMHAVTKQYVDSLIQGLDPKQSVRVATTGALPTCTYSSKVLTASANGALTIDGVSVVAGDRVLVKNQDTATQNGIYTVTNAGSSSAPWKLTRAADFDGSPSNEISAGAFTFVEEGTQNKDTGWVLSTDNPVVLDSTQLTFIQFSSASDIDAGAGLEKVGKTISLTKTGVTTGNYTKVTVDVYGRVVAGSVITASDIPALDWSKITSGKPTTLAGYGITDAVATVTDLNMVKADISDIKGFIGYTDNDIVGVEADFKNKKFTRLAGAVNKNPGADFDSIKAFGGRKRCIVTDDGKILAYYGEPGYSETGKTTVEIKKDSVTYPVGTIVQVMVEQPKFYYKVIPLELEKIPDYVEVNTLTVTAGATADGNLTITLDGVAFTVSVFATDNTPELVAAKIRNAIYTGWTTGGTGAKVTFTCNTPGTKTTATFNGGSTGVTATVEKTVAGSISIGYHMRKARYYISDTYKPGFKVHPAFIRNGVGKDKIYLPAFEGSIYDVSAAAYLLADEQVADFTVSTGDKLSSIAYAKPASGLIQNLTRANTRKLANNRGVGWQLSDVLSTSVTQMLFIIEYASFNIQDKIGLGIVNKTDDCSTNMSELTGATTNLGNASGMAAGTNGLTSVSYRGEENPWGNIWKWIDGLNIEAKGILQAYWADSGFADDIKTSPYKNCGFTLAKATGYVSAFGYSEDCDFLFLPSEVIGASNLPVGDYFYQIHNYKGFLVALLGGVWNSGLIAGAFYWNVSAASSDRYPTVGGRLLYVPQ